jgi:20S proteasome subunit beta 1
MYVGNKCSDKLEPIHQRIYCQRSGTSSHTSTIARYVRHYVDIQANELGNFPPVESAASIMREIIFNNRHSLSASMICSGWDPYKGYQIYSVNQTGFKCEKDYAISGSGSVFIAGFIDANYKPDMTKAEVKEFLKSCISLACYRDASSGGCMRLLDITKDKVEREYLQYNQFLIK